MRRQSTKVTLTCERCGATFKRFPSTVGRFCSRNCKNTPAPGSDIERFWSLVQKTDGCWERGGSRHAWGYSVFTVNGKNVGAHCYSYVLHFGPLPEDKPFVCHTCNNPPCVRPEHLYADDHAGNMRYRDACLRQARGDNHGLRLHPERAASGSRNGHVTQPEQTLRGDNHPFRVNPSLHARGDRVGGARLNNEMVRSIRAEYSPSRGEITRLSRKYSVSWNAIQRVVQGKNWTHVA